MDSRIEAIISAHERSECGCMGEQSCLRAVAQEVGKALAQIVLERSLPDARDGSHEDAAFNAALGTAADVILRAVDVEKG